MEVTMPKESTSRPKDSNVTIKAGKKGSKQFTHRTETPKGIKEVRYNYPPAGKKPQ
jgi:hypothetical protein